MAGKIVFVLFFAAAAVAFVFAGKIAVGRMAEPSFRGRADDGMPVTAFFLAGTCVITAAAGFLL